MLFDSVDDEREFDVFQLRRFHLQECPRRRSGGRHAGLFIFPVSDERNEFLRRQINDAKQLERLILIVTDIAI